jgi:hypothetical protein
MDAGDSLRSRRGCLTAIVIAAVAGAVVAVWAAVVLHRGADDPTSTAYLALQVLRGEKDAELAATEFIAGRLARRAGVPADETAALQRELDTLSKELPRLSEGEKERLAQLVRAGVNDGRVTDDELAALRDYSYKSARDGDIKP